jgi:hypothetical protein
MIASGTSQDDAESDIRDSKAEDDRFDSEAQLHKTSRRSLYRDSFGLQSADLEYAADCGSIEEQDPSLDIERVSSARSDRSRSRSGSLTRSRSGSLNRNRPGSGSLRRPNGQV